MQLIQGDCLEKMRDIPSGSVDMILCDLPFEMTAPVWDKNIDIVKVWNTYHRIIKHP